MTTISQIPKEERPRERLVQLGADALSIAELLALSLGSGRRGVSAIALAHEILAHFGDLQTLCSASLEELMKIKGVGFAKATQLKGAFALVKRTYRKVAPPRYCVRDPGDVYALVAPQFEGKKQELCAVMLRDTRGYIFHDEVLGLGTLNQVLIHPREIFSVAIQHRAYSLIIAHNHPSGDPSPSKSDIEVTKLLTYSGRMTGILLDDHLIIGGASYTSLWREGKMGEGGHPSPYRR